MLPFTLWALVSCSPSSLPSQTSVSGSFWERQDGIADRGSSAETDAPVVRCRWVSHSVAAFMCVKWRDTKVVRGRINVNLNCDICLENIRHVIRRGETFLMRSSVRNKWVRMYILCLWRLSNCCVKTTSITLIHIQSQTEQHTCNSMCSLLLV